MGSRTGEFRVGRLLTEDVSDNAGDGGRAEGDCDSVLALREGWRGQGDDSELCSAAG